MNCIEKIKIEHNQIEEDVMGLTYEQTKNYFKKIIDSKYYFRPIQIDDIKLWKDNYLDILRCNIIFANNKVIKIDGWY